MADWSKLSSRGSVDDRRASPGAIGGGIGIVGVVLVIAFNLLSGGNVSDVLPYLQNIQVQPQQIDTSAFEGNDSYEVFTSTVLGSTNDTWSQIFSAQHKTYQAPKLVLFRNSTESACGGASSAVGPHYCPTDRTIYLDETFFDELVNRFGGNGDDVAQAYVLAHEVGHHVQRALDIMDQVDRSGDATGADSDSVKLELQADCFAGLWAYSIKDRGVFEADEIQEALGAAAAVGDDRIQKSTGAQVNPETWTHGSSTERVAWFTRGYTSGTLDACDTFTAP